MKTCIVSLESEVHKFRRYDKGAAVVPFQDVANMFRLGRRFFLVLVAPTGSKLKTAYAHVK